MRVIRWHAVCCAVDVKKAIVTVFSSLPWLLSACGGSAVETSGTSAGGAATVGGTGGASSTGGSLGVSSGGSAGSAQGGTSSGGGAAFGGSASGGAGATAGAGGDCAGVACPGGTGKCAGGYHFAIPPGQCCSSCVLDMSSDCDQGRLNYQEYVQTEVAQNSFCQTDNDCVIAAEPTSCVQTCGVAIAGSARATVISALTSFAANNCSTCPATTTPGPQCPLFKAACINGACVLSAPSNR